LTVEHLATSGSTRNWSLRGVRNRIGNIVLVSLLFCVVSLWLVKEFNSPETAVCYKELVLMSRKKI
jgi:hypothetical protein